VALDTALDSDLVLPQALTCSDTATNKPVVLLKMTLKRVWFMGAGLVERF
jgi:hypothetical protein